MKKYLRWLNPWEHNINGLFHKHAHIIFIVNCCCNKSAGTKEIENFKEFKLAKQLDKYIVSPLWLQKCKKDGKRHPESLFPHTVEFIKQESPPSFTLAAPAESNFVRNIEQLFSTSMDSIQPIAVNVVQSLMIVSISAACGKGTKRKCRKCHF